jgi:hypothetical protein
MTIKRIQMALAAVLLAALTVYGFAQKPESQTHAEESNIALKRHEARVIKALGLTAKQKSAYDALQAKLDADSAKLATMKSGQVERGMQINAELHAGLKRIFTAAQYTKYMDMWAPTDLSGQDPMASGTPFGGTDEAILGKLKITSTQWAEYREYQKENEVKLQQYRELMKKDPDKGAWFGHELNRWTRSTMRRILGEDKYYEWIRLWDEVMSPYLANGAKRASQARSAGSRSVAGKAGG